MNVSRRVLCTLAVVASLVGCSPIRSAELTEEPVSTLGGRLEMRMPVAARRAPAIDGSEPVSAADTWRERFVASIGDHEWNIEATLMCHRLDPHPGALREFVSGWALQSPVDRGTVNGLQVVYESGATVAHGEPVGRWWLLDRDGWVLLVEVTLDPGTGRPSPLQLDLSAHHLRPARALAERVVATVARGDRDDVREARTEVIHEDELGSLRLELPSGTCSYSEWRQPGPRRVTTIHIENSRGLAWGVVEVGEVVEPLVETVAAKERGTVLGDPAVWRLDSTRLRGWDPVIEATVGHPEDGDATVLVRAHGRDPELRTRLRNALESLVYSAH